jgi:hypothetical protein
VLGSKEEVPMVIVILAVLGAAVIFAVGYVAGSGGYG